MKFAAPYQMDNLCPINHKDISEFNIKFTEESSFEELRKFIKMYPLHQININMLTVQGRSDIQLLLQIIKNIIAIGPILLGIYIGIYWMLIGGVINGWISFVLNSY